MGIKKQEFYEGAALHLLARTGLITALRYEPPFFLINNDFSVLLKYSTKGRSPWGFTFTANEQEALRLKARTGRTTIGLICGADGVAAFGYDTYLKIAAHRDTALRVACYRKYDEHYAVQGPDGSLDRKIAPSNWQRTLVSGGGADESR